MKKLLLSSFVLAFLLLSCQSEPEFLTPERLKIEQQNILETIKAYQEAAGKKNFGEMIPTLAGEVKFFGTDSGEVIESFTEYKKKMLEQWEEYEVMTYGEPYDVFIEMDPNANFASIIYGVQLYVKKAEYENSYQLRVARTLKKEKDKWVIVSGISSIPRTAAPISPAANDSIQKGSY